MVAFPRIPRLTPAVVPTACAAVALVAVILCLLVPIGWIERLSSASGLAAVLRAAEPPLGLTARLVLAMVSAAVVGGVSWLGLGAFARTGAKASSDIRLRRADRHPDAPARRPVLATQDLGTPLLEVEVSRRDVVDEPEADVETIEADEMPAAPEPVEAVAEAPFEGRITTFELTPMVRTVPLPEPRETSVSALLERLERGAARRGGAAPVQQRGDSIEATLAALRRLATQVG